MPLRVAVFIDSQNVYKRARSIFNLESEDNSIGQIYPLKVGQLLATKYGQDAVLETVRIYRGIPLNKLDPKGFESVRRQTASWRNAGKVEVELRPLQYPRDWSPNSVGLEKPREKGVDVQLAIDFVRYAIAGEFEVGIIFSMDNDLKPALEFIGTSYPQIQIAVCSWWPDESTPSSQRPSNISIKDINLRDIRLGRADFESLRDDTDYSHGKK